MIQYLKLDTSNLDLCKAVKLYCLDKGIDLFNSEIVFVALQDDKLVGVTAVKIAYQVEPLAADSPIIAHVLGEKALAVISATNAKQAVALVKGSKSEFIEQLEKYGFVITDIDMTILKKEL